MELKVYNQKGEETGKTKLPDSVFGLPWNAALVHQVMLGMMANKRAGTAHTKTRAEVRGGGRKPWRQKGLGRARVGSTRSPIWRHGGVAFGPRKERNYFQKINQKMKKKALLVTLSQKARDNEILILDDLKLKAPKTKEAAIVFKSLSKIKGFEKISGKKKNSIFLTPKKDESIARALRNLPNINISETRNLNLLDVLNHKYLILPKESLKIFG